MDLFLDLGVGKTRCETLYATEGYGKRETNPQGIEDI